ARPFELQALARRLDEQIGEFLDAMQLEQRGALAADELDELLGWAAGPGLQPLDSSVRRLRLAGTMAQLHRALGDAALRALARREGGAPAIASADALPPRLRGLVARVELSGAASGERWRHAIDIGDRELDGSPPH